MKLNRQPSAHDSSDQLLTTDQVAEMFNVSKKTISRWRNNGLQSGRFRVDGRQRVGFRHSEVKQFADQNRERIERGRSFSRVDPGERHIIGERLRHLSSTGESLTSAIHIIAAETGRSPSTIRSVVERHYGEVAGGTGNRTQNDAELQRLALREFRRGSSFREIAERHRASTQRVRKLVNRARLERIQQLPLDYVESEEFTSLSEQTLLGPGPESTRKRSNKIPTDLPPYLASLYEFDLLTKDQEVHLFRKYNYCKFQAAALREQLDDNSPSDRSLEKIEQLYRTAVATKNQIMESNLRLVVSITKKYRVPSEAFQDLISDGNMSLLKAIEKFDYSLGFKFSTYATWAIRRNHSGLYARRMKHSDRFRTSHEEVLDSTQETRSNPQLEEALHSQHATEVKRLLQHLSERERLIIHRRFGLGELQNGQTLQRIGEELGISKERVRQVERRAMTKLREACGKHDLDDLLPGNPTAE